MSAQDENLKAIADAIREKNATTDQIPAQEFAARILAIPTGGADYAIPLVVDAEAGTMVTASQGDTVLNGTTDDSGQTTLLLPAPGEWSVSATLGEITRGPNVISAISNYYAGFTMLSRLPDGYTELKYISNSNLGYFRGIPPYQSPFNGTRVELIISPNDESISGNVMGSQYYYYYKSGTSSQSRSTYNIIQYSKTNGVTIVSGSSAGGTYQSINFSTSEIDVENTLHIVIDLPKKVLSINGLEKETTYSSSTAYGELPACSLFANSYWYYNKPSTNGSATSYTHYGENAINFNFHYLKVYNSTADGTGDLIYYYVPCINPSGVVGIFDLVNEVFYTSADTTKAFEAGPVGEYS